MDQRWPWFDITESFLEAKSSWLQEPRTLHGSSVRFFVLAGKLVWLSRDDYELSTLAFFQALASSERSVCIFSQSPPSPPSSPERCQRAL
jgi:hypothetical protein